MIIEREPLGELHELLIVRLEPLDYKDQFERALKDQTKKVKLPGFRPGMTPTVHIRKLYGKSILMEVLSKILADLLDEFLKSNHIALLGGLIHSEDNFQNQNFEEEGDFIFKYEMGLEPLLDLGNAPSGNLKAYTISPPLDWADSEIQKIKKNYGFENQPMDEIFFSKVFPEGNINSEPQLKEWVEEGIKNRLENLSLRRIDNDIILFAVKYYPTILPHQFLKKWLLTQKDKTYTQENLPETYSGFEKSLKWSLISTQFAKIQGVEVTKEEMVSRAEDMLNYQFLAYGSESLSENLLKEYSQQILSNQEQAFRIYESIRDEKVMRFLKSNLTIHYLPIEHEEFIKLS